MYKCYGCHAVLEKLSDLSYECMCVHEESPKNRGICLSCKDKPVSEWIETPGPDHHLRRVHTFAPESDEYWKMVEREAPHWGGITKIDDEYFEFSYQVGPDGETYEDHIRTNGFDGLAKLVRKIIKLPPPPNAGLCICCEH